jgi:arylformamidase
MKIYDITAEMTGAPSYGGGEAPTVRKLAQLSAGDPYDFSLLKLTAHTATHADMPLHFIPGGMACEEIPLDRFYGAAKVLKIPCEGHITAADLQKHTINAGDIVLLCTGQSENMSDPVFREDYKALTAEAAEYLASLGVKTVGVDYLSVDAWDNGFPVHKILLGGGVTILEGLVLHHVPEGEYTLSALPLKIKGADGSPVRAILVK